MLEKFNRFCSNLEKQIIKEQKEDDAFETSDEMVSALNEKLSFDLFKKDKDLIKKIKNTLKDVRDEALDKFYDLSLKDDVQNKVISQIYHYIKEF